MKQSLTRRLIQNYVLVLILFFIVVSLSFLLIFSRYALSLQQKQMLAQAKAIVLTLEDYLNSETAVEKAQKQNQNQSQGMGKNSNNHAQNAQMMPGGTSMLLSYINNISMDHVWLVDADAQTVTVGKGNRAVKYSELTKEAEALVSDVFSGKTVISRSLSGLLPPDTITIAVPIKDSQNLIRYALFVHTSDQSSRAFILDNFSILLASLVFALLFSILLAVILSKRFIAPLRKMEQTTSRLTLGDYRDRTGIRLNDEIGSLARHIDTLGARLESLEDERNLVDQERRNFLASVSHELRTPITVMRSTLEALQEGLVDDPVEAAAYYQQLVDESRQLERLVNDLLELTRLENRDFMIEKAELNLMDVLSDALRSGRLLAQTKNIVIELTNELPAYPFWGDYGRLRQMFLILLENAIKFSPVGAKVELFTLLINGHLNIHVKDHGPGIAADELENIFRKFYQLPSLHQGNGSGLGLSIAQEIALRHDMHIRAESTEGCGAEFIIELAAETHAPLGHLTE